MSSHTIDYLLIGQGLAGTVLAEHLRAAGCSLRLIHAQHRPSASRAAAGLYNPITGRKMVKTWRADELFPYLESFYSALERRLDASFFHPTPLYRPFLTIEEQNDWSGRADNIHLSPYVRQVALSSTYGTWVHDPLGGLLVQQCGYLNVPALLQAYQQDLRSLGVYEEAEFDPQRLKLYRDYATYDQWRAQKVIFCDGASGRANPFFQWLPFHPVKGEMLMIKPEQPVPIIFNRGVFILPQGDTCKVGSTYHHHDLDDVPTEEGRQTLTQKLDQLLTLPYTVLDQWAGVRPATRDRLPFIGYHPKYEPLAVFNGFGTKGVSLTPYFAQHFVHCLINNDLLDETVDIRRYYSMYQAAHLS